MFSLLELLHPQQFRKLDFFIVYFIKRLTFVAIGLLMTDEDMAGL